MDRTALNKTIIALLKKHKGDMAAVQADLTQDALKNPKTLLAITAPHLNGLVGYAVQSVATHFAKGDIAENGQDKNQRRAKKIDTELADKLGLEMLKSMAGTKPAKFGHEKAENLGRARAASPRHVAAIQAIAKAQKLNSSDK